jgi:hypothetical protein
MRPIWPKPSSTISTRAGSVTVDPALRFRGAVAVDHDGDVELRRALRDRHHVDPARCQRGEDAGRDAGRPRHAEAHHRHRGDAVAQVHAVDLAPGDLVAELVQQRGARLARGRIRDAEADRVLGGGLRDERHRDAARLERGEGPRGDAGHAEHAVPGDGDEGLARGRGERLHREPRGAHALRDLGPRRARIGERPDEEGDAPPRERDEGARVEHLGAVVGELGRLAGVHRGHHARIRHDPRVGGEEPGHVLPEGDARGAERAGDERGGQVRAPPAERSDLPVGRGADEAGDDGHDAPRDQRRQQSLRRPVGPLVVRRRLPEVRVRAHDLRRLDVPPPRARRPERRRHQARAQPLAARGDEVAGARRQVAEEAEPGGHRLELVALGRDAGEQLRAGRPRRHRRARRLRVLAPQLRDELRDRPRVAGLRPGGDREQRVRRAGHGRDDDHGRLGAVGADDSDRVTDRGSVGQRSPAELVDVRGASG